MSTLTPLSGFDDLRGLVRRLPQADGGAAAAAAAREATLTKPAGALGRLEELAAWLSAWQGRHPPRLERVLTTVFVGWHDIARHKVSAYPAEVTDQMVANFKAGGAAINQLARLAGSELAVIPVGHGRPAHDFTRRPAMSEAGCIRAINIGLAALPEPVDLLAVGEMGIANTTAAAAVAAALYREPAREWTGPGTGLDARGVRHKAEVIAQALDRHQAALTDPLAILRHLGGRELAAMLGIVLAARLRGVPVLLDGFAGTIPAAILHALDPAAIAHCRSAHRSVEPGHRRLLARLGLVPLLDLDLRLGEASGAALAIQLARAAVACHTGMATFADAGVSGKEPEGAAGMES